MSSTMSPEGITEQEGVRRAHLKGEARWRQMTNALPQLVWTSSPEGQCEFFSHQWVQYTGLPQAQQLGVGWLAQVHEDDRPVLIERWHHALRTAFSFSLEFRLRRHDGVYRWFDTRAHAIRDPQGKVLQWVGSNTDIEDRKQAEAEIQRLNKALEDRVDAQAATIRQSERDMRAILDHTPAMMGYWDAQLRSRFANHAYSDWFGIDPEQIPGMHIRDVIGEERYQANLPYIQGALQGQEQRFERAISMPDRRAQRHSQAHYLPDIDEQGHIQGFYVTVTDVTPIKEAQARAEELLRFSEAVIEHSPVGLCVFTPDGQCVIANPAMADLLGGQVDALRAQNFRHLPSWRDTALLSEAEATLQDGLSRQVDLDVLSTFGKQVHAIVTLSRVDRGGQPHLLLIAQDVTSQRKIHDALVAARDSAQYVARTKSAFLANMSHEIRTPMNAIVGLSRLALEDHLPPKSREFLGKVHSSALALMEILDEVLDYSKIEAGQMRVESIPMDLQDVLRRVTDLFCGRIEQKGLTLNTDVAPDVPHWVMGDPLRLTQIINNLVGNAVKFTDSGSISISIERTDEHTAQANSLRFRVKDTGMGIAPGYQSILFDAFTQADTSITRRFGGTGLGLTICKSLVTMMSGRIGVRSELGEGSEFWFSLPMAPTDAPAGLPSQVDRRHSSIKGEEASTMTELEQLSNRRVLLAEDNRLNQMVATEFLTRMGLEVTVVDNGLEALDTIKAAPVDHFAAILMDLHMPVMDGLESTRRIRALPGRDRTPIIAMTAAALAEDRSACMGVGMVDHLPKPVMPEQLLKVLRKWMVPTPLVETMTLEPPPMPGFDLPGLNERVHGNERLMWLLLAQLAEQEAPSGDILAQLMAQGDIEAARHRAHDLKGCAANLGAQALSDASARLESALKQGRLDHEALAALQQTLNESLACIRTHLAWRAQTQAQATSH